MRHSSRRLASAPVLHCWSVLPCGCDPEFGSWLPTRLSRLPPRRRYTTRRTTVPSPPPPIARPRPPMRLPRTSSTWPGSRRALGSKDMLRTRSRHYDHMIVQMFRNAGTALVNTRNDMKPFRFAAGIRSATTRAEFANAVRDIERLGYSALMLSDHLVDQFAPISALGVAAAVTSTLRLGTFVFNNDLRHPVVLAQELATLDRLSDGRLEIGMGAGWNKPEYEGAGIPYDPGATRIDRLAESIAIMKSLFADGPIDFEGRFYRVRGFEDLPRPIQRPHPPFFVGGGSPRLLRLAAQQAQIVGIAPRVRPDGKADVMGCTLAGSEA